MSLGNIQDSFNGLYLGLMSLSPMDGIGPSELAVDALLKFVLQALDSLKEVIEQQTLP